MGQRVVSRDLGEIHPGDVMYALISRLPCGKVIVSVVLQVVQLLREGWRLHVLDAALVDWMIEYLCFWIISDFVFSNILKMID